MKTAKRSLPALLAAMMIVMMLVPVRAYGAQYVLNTNTGKFHVPGCASVARMKEKNKSYVDLSYSEVIAMGYQPCQNCHPERGASASASAAAPVQARAAASVSQPLTASAPAAQAPVRQAPAAPSSEQILQAAYAAYIQAGLSSDAALSRVQAKAAEFLAAPANIAAIVQADLASLAAPAAAPVLSPDQIVQQAFALYVQAGLDANTALARVQAKLAEFLAAPENIPAIVQADVLALQSGGAAALTPEQKVQQAFAALVAQGMSADQAMAAVQANLAAILAQ